MSGEDFSPHPRHRDSLAEIEPNVLKLLLEDEIRTGYGNGVIVPPFDAELPYLSTVGPTNIPSDQLGKLDQEIEDR